MISTFYRFSSVLMTLAMLVAIASVAAPWATAQDEPPIAVPGEYIVKYKDGAVREIRRILPNLEDYSDEEIREALTESIGAQSKDELPLINAETVKTPDGEDIDAEAALDLIDADLVDYIVPNYIVTASAVPNDPSYSSLWGMNQANDVDINAPEAWDVTTGGSTPPVVVGVVDTGVDYNHPDLAANMWVNTAEKNGTPGIDDDGNGVIDDIHGYNAIASSGNPWDDNEHGTHCAGTIAAVANNGIGVAGVSWNAKIMALKFLGSNGSGSDADAIKAIGYAVMMKNRGVNIRVLSNSWGGSGQNAAMLQAIQAANDAGLLFVAAAGNSAQNNDATPNWPSNYEAPNVLAVAAVQSNGGLASFSSYGATTVDVGAPGVGILSTTPNNGYKSFNGTSMATPHVSGVAALVYARIPGYSPTDVKYAIMSTTKPLASLSGKTVTGGMVNARDALANPSNFPPVLAAIADQTVSPISRVKTISLSATDQENNALTFTAEILPSVQQQVAAAADQAYGFTAYQPQYDNYYRLGEKRLVSSDGKTYIILSNGNFYELVLPSASFRGTVDPSYYQDPTKLVDAYPISTTGYGSVRIIAGTPPQLEITSASGFLGSFSVRVSVSDGNRTDSKSFLVTVRSVAPTIAPIADRTMSPAANVDTVDVQVTHPDGAPVTVSASIAASSVAYELDARYDFASYDPQYNNQRGLSERYLQSTNGLWFFILPDGRLFLLSTPVEQSSYLGTVGTAGYANPASLINVAAPSAAGATVSVSPLSATSFRVTVDPPAGYRGSLRVTVSATDGITSASRSFLESIIETPPTLSMPSVLAVPARLRSLTFQATATDADSDPLTFAAQAENNTAAYQLDQQYDFTTVMTAWENTYSRSEKYIQNAAGTSFYILPSGAFYRWAGTIDLSVYLGQLDTYYYENPALLVNVPAPVSLSGLTVTTSTSGSTASITVTAPSAFSGTVWVRVSVSDGLMTTSKRVSVSFTNGAPVFGSLPSRTMGMTQTSMGVSIPVSDPDGDGVVLSVTGVQSVADLFRVFQMDRRIITYKTGADNQRGAQEKSFLGADGREYYLLPSGALYEWRGSFGASPQVYVLDASYYANPALLTLAGHVVINYLPEKDNEAGFGEKYYTANDGALYYLRPDGGFYMWGGTYSGSTFVRSYPTSFYASPMSVINQTSQALVVATVSGTTLNVSRQARYVDTFIVNLRASDGFAVTTASLRVTVQNQPPTLLGISDRVMSSNARQDIIRFNATDLDGEALTYRADLVNYEKLASDACRQNDLVSYVVGSDNARGWQEKYFTARNGQWYFLLPNGALSRWGGSPQTSVLVATVDSSLHARPDELLRLCSSTVGSPGTIRISGSDIIYDRLGTYMGTFRIDLTATDASGTPAKVSFRISVQNSAPVLVPIDDQVMGESVNTLTVPLGANDPDGNALVYSAQVLPATATPASLAVLDFGLRSYVPQFDNYRGAEERYITSASGALFFLLPDGGLYRAGRTIAASQLVASLDPSYYEDPTTLVNTPPAPTAGLPTASVSGASVTLTRTSGFFGAFTVRISVSDGFASSQGTFRVNALAPAVIEVPDSPSDGDVQRDPSSDTDGDGVSDEDEITQGSDPFDAGSFQQPIAGPLVYSLWNSFLAMTNILELVNPQDYAKQIVVKLFGIDGTLLSSQTVTVPARSQFDLILNDLPGFTADSYGLVRIEFDGLIDGRMFYYRSKPGTSEFEFAFGVPLANPSFGNTVVGFNTFQPSLAPAERDNVVANWLTVVNLSSQEKSFNVYTYSQDGTELVRRELRVPGFGRSDVDGGHGIAGPSVVGLHSIEPVDPNAPYIAQLIRYGGMAPAGVTPSEFNFAFPLSARAGTGRTLHVPISDQFSESNWVEVANAKSEPVTFHLTFMDAQGRPLRELEEMLPAHAQKHFFASAYLSPGTPGVVKIEPSVPDALVAQSMFYFREAATGKMSAMYGSQARQAIGRALFGSYNLFLGMMNWLKVINTSSASARVQVIVNSSAGSVEQVLDLPPNGIVVLPIHDSTTYHTTANSYGTVEVRTTEGAAAYAELLRLKKDGNQVDFAAPTTVR